jgi:hypothetical protein
MEEKSENGKLLSLSEEKKKFIENYVEEITTYEKTLLPLEETATDFINGRANRIKQEPVHTNQAKFALKVISDLFEERKRPLKSAIERLEKEFVTMDEIISELDERKFIHRIEKINGLRSLLMPHFERINQYIQKIDQKKMEKLEEAKTVIMKGHRKEFLEKF